MHDVSRTLSALSVAWEADDDGPAALHAVLAALVEPGDRVEVVGPAADALWPPLAAVGALRADAGHGADLVVVAGAASADLDVARARVRPGGRVVVAATNASHVDGRAAGDPAALALDALDRALAGAGLLRVRLHRILVPVARGAVAEAALQAADAETRTFVAVTVRHDGDAEVMGLAGEVDALQAALVRQRARHALDGAALGGQITELQEELVSRDRRIAALEQQVAGLEEHLEAIMSTLTFRVVAPLRALYGRIRAR